MEATRRAARDRGDPELAASFDRLTDTEAWLRYAVDHSRQVCELGRELHLPIHLCPHYQLVRAADGAVRAWFESWRERQPPEAFAGRPTPDRVEPEPPADPP